MQQQAALDLHPILGGQTIVIPIVQNKGGAGKSTTAVNLAAELAALGYETVVIDMDPQEDTTFHLLGEPPDDEDVPDPFRTPNLFTVLSERVAQTLLDLVQPTRWEHLYIIPGTFWVTELEAACEKNVARDLTLYMAMDALRGYFDFVIVDCPSWMGFPTKISVIAGDQIIIPVQAQPRSLRASTRTLDVVRETAANMRRTLKRLSPSTDPHGPQVLGLVLTMRKHSWGRRSAELLQSAYEGTTLIFTTSIPYREAVTQDVVRHAPLRDYLGEDDEARQSYAALAREVLQRLQIPLPTAARRKTKGGQA
jgi:chromosome partitioning protein